MASVFQTGLNLMRDLRSRGVQAFGVDCDTRTPGFRSRYGTSRVCPDPDADPQAWLGFMLALACEIGQRPVLIAAADQFVSAIGRHACELQAAYLFSEEGARLQAEFATKERQYVRVKAGGFPCPATKYVQTREEVAGFAAASRFPCVLKPRHMREWSGLPPEHALHGQKLAVVAEPSALVSAYVSVAPYQPHAIVQEVIEGADQEKYCYIAVYASDRRRLGFCIVRELRTWPPCFGSASIVESVADAEIEALCDGFLQRIGYVGIVEMELKRDSRDGRIKLIELNPRFSITGDCARYLGVPLGWLHYSDLVGERHEAPPYTLRRRHIALGREVCAVPAYFRRGELSWRQLASSYRPPVDFFDLDLRDPRVAIGNAYSFARALAGALLR